MAADFFAQRFNRHVQKRRVVKAMIQVGAGFPTPVGMPLPLRWGADTNPAAPRRHLKTGPPGNCGKRWSVTRRCPELIYLPISVQTICKFIITFVKDV